MQRRVLDMGAAPRVVVMEMMRSKNPLAQP